MWTFRSFLGSLVWRLGVSCHSVKLHMGKKCAFCFSWKMAKADHIGLSFTWQQVAGVGSSAVFRQDRCTLVCLGLYLFLHLWTYITGLASGVTWKWTGILGFQLLMTTPMSFWFPRDFLTKGKQFVPASLMSLQFCSFPSLNQVIVCPTSF